MNKIDTLRVFDIVRQKCPITTDQIAQASGLSRSTIVRTLEKLEADFCIRKRLDDRHYMTTSRADPNITHVLPAFSFIERLTSEIMAVENQKYFRMRIFQKGAAQTFIKVDDSLSEDEQLVAIVSGDCEPFYKHLRALAKLKYAEEFPAISDRSNVLPCMIRQGLHNKGYFWDREIDTIFIPLFDPTHPLIVVGISHKDPLPMDLVNGKLAAEKLINTAKMLRVH